jgi:pimeloyl-ACP methyl ester carboxylesterase
MPADAFSRMITAGEISLHYLDLPGDKPPLLLLHGLTANAHAFDGLKAAGLPFRLLSPDLRGRGKSSKPDTGYSMADHAADVLALMQAEGLDKVNLGGHSFGGLLGFYMAVHFPDKIHKLVILDAAAQLHPDTKDMLLPTLSRLGQTYSSFEEYLQKIRQSPYLAFWDPAMMSYYQADVETLADGSVSPRSKPEHMGEAIVKGSFGENWLKLIPQVSQPVLLVNGIEDYALGAPLLPQELAQQTVDLMPDARYAAVTGNHQTMLYGQGAKETVEAIVAFMAQD